MCLLCFSVSNFQSHVKGHLGSEHTPDENQYVELRSFNIYNIVMHQVNVSNSVALLQGEKLNISKISQSKLNYFIWLSSLLQFVSAQTAVFIMNDHSKFHNLWIIIDLNRHTTEMWLSVVSQGHKVQNTYKSGRDKV